MKTLKLALVGILAFGATSLLADGSQVSVNKNKNLNIVNKSKVVNSTIGMKIDAKDSRVKANKNKNLNIVNKSKVYNSTVGIAVKAQ